MLKPCFPPLVHCQCSCRGSVYNLSCPSSAQSSATTPHFTQIKSWDSYDGGPSLSYRWTSPPPDLMSFLLLYWLNSNYIHFFAIIWIASIFPLGPCFSSSQPKKGFPSHKLTYFTLHPLPLPQVPANYYLHNVAFSDHLFNLLSTWTLDNIFTLHSFLK